MGARRRLAIPLAVAAAAGGSVAAAWAGALWLEARSLDAVRGALAEGGLDWATVETDGLRVAVGGTAPDEPARLRAITRAGGVVEPSRIVDAMDVEPAAPPAPPRYSLELLRNDDALSLIGLVPGDGTRGRLGTTLDDYAVTDMVEVADRAMPDAEARAWRAALGYALAAVETLPQSKVSVAPGGVAVSAVAASDGDRRALEARLRRDAPEGLAVDLRIQAPRPVVAPFTTRFALDEGGARFDACAADDDAARARIEAAARAAGFEGDPGCVVALGAPSADWGEAAAAAIAAVARLGGGTVTLSDADVTLAGADGVEAGAFDAAAAELEAALPALYGLTAIRPEPELTSEAAAERGIPEFTASRSPEGAVLMRGRVRDAGQEAAVAAYGRAMLGSAEARLSATRDDALPDGWPVRVLAGIEALSRLDSGAVTVRPDLVAVEGRTGRREGEAEVAALLSEKLGERGDFRVEVAYDERLDPTLAIPTPDQCVDRLAETQADAKLSFAPGAAVIEAASAELLGDIVAVLRDCAREVFEVGGHTDSQGREVMNQELSAARAEAVRAALIERGVAPSQLVAVGYGEAEPIADNDTEAGRESNRRIAFTLAVARDGGAAAEAGLDGAAAPGEDAAEGEAPEAGAPEEGGAAGRPAEAEGGAEAGPGGGADADGEAGEAE